jgi:hypothetical protein
MWNSRFKYKNVKSKYKDRVYHSRAESEYAMWLDSLLRAKKIKKITPQFKVDLYVYDKNGKRYCLGKHYPDFLVELNNGVRKIVECKGFGTREWKQFKMPITKMNYPDIEYLVNPDEKSLLNINK